MAAVFSTLRIESSVSQRPDMASSRRLSRLSALRSRAFKAKPPLTTESLDFVAPLLDQTLDVAFHLDSLFLGGRVATATLECLDRLLDSWGGQVEVPGAVVLPQMVAAMPQGHD